MSDFTDINNYYTITNKVDIFPPWKKCVKKTFECSVKKENLFDPPAGGEFFLLAERIGFKQFKWSYNLYFKINEVV